MENSLRYKCFMMQERLVGLDNVAVGYIYDIEKDEPILGIYINEEYLKVTKNRECMVNYGTETRKSLAIVSNKLALRLQRNNPIAWFQIYHELGHLVLKHWQGRDGNVDVDKYRIEAALDGGVDEHELEADAFAVSIVGQEIAVNALRKLMNDRRKYDIENGLAGTPLAELSRLEYKRRIMAVLHPELAE